MKYSLLTSLLVAIIVNAEINDENITDEEKDKIILSIFDSPINELNPIEQSTATESSNQQTTTTTISTSTNNLTNNLGCGIRNVGGLRFNTINTSQNTAGFGEFPWTVAILDNNGVAVSAGSLIHPKIVLTVYHHVKRYESTPDTLKVRAGEWDTRSTAEPLPYQERSVLRIIGHPDYNNQTHPYNVAIIELVGEFILNVHINTICLPSAGSKPYQKNCFATGWGSNAFGSNQRNTIILKKVPLGIVDSDKCQQVLQHTQLGRHFRLHSTFVCAGGVSGVDTCQGDGGAPLMCPIGRPEEHRYWQTGIVAWGIGCGRTIPAVYTNVAMVRQWIDEVVQFIGLDTNTYTFDLTQTFDVRSI